MKNKRGKNDLEAAIIKTNINTWGSIDYETM